MTTKLCKTCSNLRDVSEFEFKADGTQLKTCKFCREYWNTPEYKEKQRARHKKNADRINAALRERYQSDEEYRKHRQEQNRAFWSENREEINERQRNSPATKRKSKERWQEIKNNSVLHEKQNARKRESQQAISKRLQQRAVVEGDWTEFKKYLWRRTKDRAFRKGIPFSITVDDIVIPDVCPIFKTKFVLSSDNYHPDKPTIDKKVPELGYVAGNICIISFKANRMKNNLTVDDLDRIRAYMDEDSADVCAEEFAGTPMITP